MNKKRILLIATGGTVACKKSENGLTPILSTEEILSFVPEVNDFCQVESVQLFNIDSTNIAPDHWLRLAATIRENYDLFDGFVILHGPDTMAYTAAVLSYLIQGGVKPIILTGAQKPIDTEVTDAKTNLFDSFLYCARGNSRGVRIVFDGKVILGTRAKKTHSKSYSAFSSINYPYVAIIRDGKIMNYRRFTGKKPVKFYDELDVKVGLFKFVPGSDARLLDSCFSLSDAVIMETFGTGGIPDGEGFGFYDVIDKWSRKGKIIVSCTQVENEGSDMTVYKVGKSVKEKFGFLESYDMTLEATVAKLMWILAITKNKNKVKKMFYTNVDDDILYTD
ncbi:MAG: asparaginase [Clostridia bacterium]|nr:asparaginase [Clostridia bacterium]